MIQKYVFFNKYDTLLLMTGSISMNSELNKIDNVIINNGMSPVPSSSVPKGERGVCQGRFVITMLYKRVSRSL